MTNMFNNEPNVPDLTEVAERYKNDPNEYLKALAHKEAHIQRLEQEARERQEALTKSKTLEDVLAELKQSAVTPPPSQAPTSANPQSVLVDDKELEQKLDKMLREKAEKERIEQAKAEVSSTLLEKFGTKDKAVEAMQNKARELSLTVEALDAIALNSPKAFYQLFGIENTQRQVNIAPTVGSIRTNISETPKSDPIQEFRDILRQDRNKAMSPEVQAEIMRKAYAQAGIKR